MKHLKASTRAAQTSTDSSHYACNTKHAIHDNKIRKKVHSLARILGLESEYVGQYPYRHHLELKTPRNLDLNATLESILAMNAADFDHVLSNKIRSYNRRVGKQLRHERFERWVDRKSCDSCGCGNDYSALGFARDGTILCVDCWEADPVLSPYKWEDLESCYMCGAI